MTSTWAVQLWRLDNPERYEEHKRRAIAKARKRRLTMTREERNEEREYYRVYMANRRAYAKECRKELRSIQSAGLVISDEPIDLWSATDGQVIQLWRDWERKIAYAEQQNARKRKSKQR